MTSFLYAFPGEDNNSVTSKLEGLDYAFENGMKRGLNRIGFDPNEPKECALVADDSLPGELLSLDQAKQTWQRAGDMFIGYWNDFPPTEETLRRNSQLSGRKLAMGGEHWTVPIAVSFEEVNGQIFSKYHLSRYVTFGEEGELTYGDFEEQFAPLMEIAQRWVDTALPGQEKPTVRETWTWSGQIMSFNYRMSFREMCMLRLLSDESSMGILDICIDASSIPLLQEFSDEQKKTIASSRSTAEECDSSDGETAEPSAISQQLQI